MPQFEHLHYTSRYNTLRLLGYDYTSTKKLCAVTLVTDSRKPIFADMLLAKAVLTSLLSPETRANMHLRAFTLMPDHLHFLAGVHQPEFDLSRLIGAFKSFTTQLYWKRSREVVASGEICLPSEGVSKTNLEDSRGLIPALIDRCVTLRPEVVKLKNWPSLRPESFVMKQLWQPRFFDHVIRNDKDLRENVDYIVMNPVRAGYVARSYFYPYTGFMD